MATDNPFQYIAFPKAYVQRFATIDADYLQLSQRIIDCLEEAVRHRSYETNKFEYETSLSINIFSDESIQKATDELVRSGYEVERNNHCMRISWARQTPEQF